MKVEVTCHRRQGLSGGGINGSSSGSTFCESGILGYNNSDEGLGTSHTVKAPKRELFCICLDGGSDGIRTHPLVLMRDSGAPSHCLSR